MMPEAKKKQPAFKVGTAIMNSGYYVDENSNAWWVNVEDKEITKAEAEDEEG
jgi:hypothetical protein